MDPYDTGRDMAEFNEDDEDEDDELPARVPYAVILQEEEFEDEDSAICFFRPLQ
jgi:hypothetical protein